MQKGLDYTIEYFRKCLTEEGEISFKPSEVWSDDQWWIDQDNRTFIQNEGYLVINEGRATGPIVGGNHFLLNSLQGTEYMPNLDGSIVFIEDIFQVTPEILNNNLDKLLKNHTFQNAAGIVIARFQREERKVLEPRAENELFEHRVWLQIQVEQKRSNHRPELRSDSSSCPSLVPFNGHSETAQARLGRLLYQAHLRTNLSYDQAHQGRINGYIEENSPVAMTSCP